MKELLYLYANCFSYAKMMADIKEKSFYRRIGQHLISIGSATLLIMGMSTAIASAQVVGDKGYKPIPLQTGKEVNDTLSEHDIPLGEDGGFARDYAVSFQAGELAIIELASENFDTIVTLLGEAGAKVAESDDGPDGSTNSLLLWRFTKSGKYIIRVHAFGQTGGGQFKLRVTRLDPNVVSCGVYFNCFSK